MIIDGKYVPNMTCTKCHFRHPADMSCEAAAEYVRMGGKVKMADRGWLDITEEELTSDPRLLTRALLQWCDYGASLTAEECLHIRSATLGFVRSFDGTMPILTISQAGIRDDNMWNEVAAARIREHLQNPDVKCVVVRVLL